MTEPEPAPPTLRDVPWRLSDVLLGLAGPLVYWVAALILGRPSQLDLPRWVIWVAWLLPPMAWMALFPIWAARRRLPAWRPLLPAPSAVLREALWSLPLTLATYFALFIVMLAIYLAFGDRAEPPNVAERAIRAVGGPAERVTLLVVLVTLGPLAEELTFRGLLYNALRRRLHVPVALLAQALVFGVLHTYSASYVAAATIIGLALGLAYEWRRTLLTPLFMHMTFNLIATGAAVAMLIGTPVLGVAGEPDEEGCRITAVSPGGPAEQAGLRPGDLLTTVAGEPVRTLDDIRARLRAHKPDEGVEVTYLRDGKLQTTRVVLQSLWQTRSP